MVKVIPEKCIGCGLCEMLAEENFAMDDETGKAIVTKDEENEDVIDAINNCPTRAIIQKKQ